MTDKSEGHMKIDSLQWRRGVISGYFGNADDEPTLSFASGKVEGVAAAERGEPLNDFLIRNTHPSEREAVTRWLRSFDPK